MKDSIGVISFPCFTHEEVKEINKEIEKNILRKEDISEAAIRKGVVKIGDFFPIPLAPLMGLLHPWLYQCQQANKKIFGYDINWNFHLESLNYNVYGVKGEYGWHIDASKEQMFDVKLTCLLNLSEEPYEGGEFYTIGRTESMKFDSGMGLIFNSLIAHKVTPITKGKRITLTYWADGPTWR